MILNDDSNNYINDFLVFLFFQIFGVLKNHPQENLTMLWLYTMYMEV